MLGQADQMFRRYFRFILGVVGMDADGAENVVVFFGDRPNGVELGDPGADGQHVADAGLMGAADDVVQLAVEIGEVQMAVAVDEH